jgi:hypothetical protein
LTVWKQPRGGMVAQELSSASPSSKDGTIATLRGATAAAKSTLGAAAAGEADSGAIVPTLPRAGQLLQQKTRPLVLPRPLAPRSRSGSAGGRRTVLGGSSRSPVAPCSVALVGWLEIARPVCRCPCTVREPHNTRPNPLHLRHRRCLLWVFEAGGRACETSC